jgi:hypothetical protein
MLTAFMSRLQKYNPLYRLNMKKPNTMTSIELYQAMAVKAVIARGIVRFAPNTSKFPPTIPLLLVVWGIIIVVGEESTATMCKSGYCASGVVDNSV